jgi:hypothetical protein
MEHSMPVVNQMCFDRMQNLYFSAKFLLYNPYFAKFLTPTNLNPGRHRAGHRGDVYGGDRGAPWLGECKLNPVDP